MNFCKSIQMLFICNAILNIVNECKQFHFIALLHLRAEKLFIFLSRDLKQVDWKTYKHGLSSLISYSRQNFTLEFILNKKIVTKKISIISLTVAKFSHCTNRFVLKVNNFKVLFSFSFFNK